MGGGASKPTIQREELNATRCLERRERVHNAVSGGKTVFRKAGNKMDDRTKDLLKNSLKSFFFLSDSENLDEILALMQYEELSMGAVLINEGEIEFKMYVLERGSLNVTQKGAHVKKIDPGDAFGELALIYSSHRNASVTVESPDGATLWSLSQDAFRHVRNVNRTESVFKRTAMFMKGLFFPLLSVLK